MSADGEAAFPVTADEAGMRLDALVSRRLNLTAAAARRLIEAGQVRVDGRRRPKGATMVTGMRVTVAAPAPPAPAATDVPVAFIYEDPSLIAIAKPAGMPSHPLRDGERGTAASAIVARYAACATASVDPREGGLGHRLDTATSGVLVAARDREAWLGLRRALGAIDCQKRYLAEVWGQPPDEGATAAAIGRRGRRGGTVRLDGGRHPLAAETRWKVLARGAETALIEARLHAGRAHQVRAHLAGAGFPLVGDDRYDDRHGERAATPVPGLHLHAAAVSFTHPVTGRPLTIEAPPPAWAEPRAWAQVSAAELA